MRKALERASRALGCLFLLCALCGSALSDDTSVRDYTTSFDDLLRQEQAARQNNASGLPAPTCADPGCRHVTQNQQGQDEALCPLGQWLLDGNGGMTLYSASLAYPLALTGGENRIYRSGTFYVTGGDSTTTLIVNTDRNVSLRLDGAKINRLQLSSGSSAGITIADTGAATSAVTSVMSQGGTLNVSGNQRYTSIEGDKITLSGTGTVRVGYLRAVVSSRSQGGFLLIYDDRAPGAMAELQEVPLVAASDPYEAPLTVTYYDKATGLCFPRSSTAPVTLAYAALRKPEPNNVYQAEVSSTNHTCAITMVDAPSLYVLQNGGNDVNVTADCVIRSVPGATQTVNVTQSASVELHNASTSGGLNIEQNAVLYAYGCCSMGALTVGPGATVIVRGRGALTVGALTVAGTLTIDPQTNFRPASLPERIGGLQPTQVLILGDGGAPVANRDVILKIGGDGGGFPVRTDGDGRITLWRAARLNAVDVVALSGNDTYAAVITGGSGTADALPVIHTPVCTRTSDVAVTVTTQDAGTVGLQYLIGDQAQPMPDVYLPAAQLLYAPDGKFVLRDVPYGKVVTLRAFAARNANIPLNEYTTDAFVFSEKLDVKSPFVLEPQSKVYNGYPFAFAQGLIPADATVTWYKKKPLETDPPSALQPAKKPAQDEDGEDDYAKPLSDAPWKVGAYIARVTLPATNPSYAAGNYFVDVTIQKKLIYIHPMGDSKQKGEPDPELLYDTDPLCRDDEMVLGELSRMKGERYGNYPYRIGSIHAEDMDGNHLSCYEFAIAPGSPYFFIDWNYHHYIPLNPLDIIDPVYDEVQLGSGGTLRVQRRTSPVISLNNTYFGTLVTDVEDERARPFTPSLRVRKGEDKVLLILTAESELRKDGGYDTDRDGRLNWRGRRLKLGYWHIAHLRQNHISDMAFQLNGVSLLFSLDELVGPDMDELLRQNRLAKSNTYFYFELEPVLRAEGLAAGETAATGTLTDGGTVMRVRAYLRNGDKQAELAPALRGAQLLFDAGALLGSGKTVVQEQQADITETVNGKPVEPAAQPEAQTDAELAGVRDALETAAATGDELELAGQLISRELARKNYALRRFADQRSTALDSQVVVPYTASEAKTMAYAALMRARPFLMAAYPAEGLYGLGGE